MIITTNLQRSCRPNSCSYLEYGDPSESDVVERYSALKRVVADWATRAVILVPVDAAGLWRHRRVCAVPRQFDVVDGQITSLTVVLVRRNVGALGHTVLVRLATDEVFVALAHVILAEIKPTVSKTGTC